MKRRWIITLLLASTVILCAAASLHPAAKPWHSVARCLMVRFTSFQRLEDGVYASPGFSKEECLNLMGFIEEARSRVGSLFGDCRAHPTVLFCQTPALYTHFSGSRLPYSLVQRTPIGDFVVVGPWALSTMFVMHELVHCETDTRLGWWRSTNSVPMWFHEGLAVVLSEDPRFGEESLKESQAKYKMEPRLSDMVSASDFNNLTAINSMLSYGAARREVARWYAAHQANGLRRLVSEIAAGREFDAVYKDPPTEPNKMSDSTTSAGTSAAQQPRVPASVASHH